MKHFRNVLEEGLWVVFFGNKKKNQDDCIATILSVICFFTLYAIEPMASSLK